MRDKKFKFTSETIQIGNHTLHRIQALRHIRGRANAGDLGGFVESPQNLSDLDTAWVAKNACVYGNAIVSHDALVTHNARVCGNARVDGQAIVEGAAKVYGHAHIGDRARVADNATVKGEALVLVDATITGNATIAGRASVWGQARVDKNATVRGFALVHDFATVTDSAFIGGRAVVGDHVTVKENAIVGGCAELRGRACMSANMIALCPSDILTIGPIGSRDYYLTVNIPTGLCTTGCFIGTIDDLIKAARTKSLTHPKTKEYLIMIHAINGIISFRRTGRY